MGPATRNLRTVATYWAPLVNDQWGMKTFAAPVKISSRWMQGGELIIKASGEEYVAKTVVFVDRDVEGEGYLVEGDYTTSLDPHTVADAREIQAYRATPDLRNLEQERKVFL